jgi:hypothetical protein
MKKPITIGVIAVITTILVASSVDFSAVGAKPTQTTESILSTFEVPLKVFTSDNGRVTNGSEGFSSAILYYGDTLCGFEQVFESGLIVVFAKETLVKHDAISCGAGGTTNPIILATSQDEIFQPGDVLALHNTLNGSPADIVEVHREQTP